MYKPTLKETVAIILIGVGTVVALAFTDFGPSGGALIGMFIVLAEYRACARRSTSGSCRTIGPANP